MIIMSRRSWLLENTLKAILVITICCSLLGCAEKEIPPENYQRIVAAIDSLPFGKSNSLADRLYAKHNAHLLPQIIRDLDANSVFRKEDGVMIILSSSPFAMKGFFVPDKCIEFSGKPRNGTTYERLANRLYRFRAD